MPWGEHRRGDTPRLQPSDHPYQLFGGPKDFVARLRAEGLDELLHVGTDAWDRIHYKWWSETSVSDRIKGWWALSDSEFDAVFREGSRVTGAGPRSERTIRISAANTILQLQTEYEIPSDIPAVVRQPLAALGGKTILQELASGNEQRAINAYVARWPQEA